VRVQLESSRTQDVLSMDQNTLDYVEVPLRHFFSALGPDNILLPTPTPSSIRDQIIQINFETPPHRTIALSLAVDAGPGCGGIAWPAGEVRSLNLFVLDA
jgi:protein N-lysine methyltransferase METTL21A